MLARHAAKQAVRVCLLQPDETGERAFRGNSYKTLAEIMSGSRPYFGQCPANAGCLETDPWSYVSGYRSWFNTKFPPAQPAGTYVVPYGTTEAFASTNSAEMCYTTDGVTEPACAADGSSCALGAFAMAETAVPALTANTVVKVIGCADAPEPRLSADGQDWLYGCD